VVNFKTDHPMPYSPTRALELLRLGTQNPSAAFHDGQEDAIQHVVGGCGRLLVVQKTGWGKSAVYFIATKLLREEGMGPAILISPLLALMRNQIAAAERMGVRAVTINSENQAQWRLVEAALTRNEVDILLISPERLANEHFRTEVLARSPEKFRCWSSMRRTASRIGVMTSVHITVLSSAFCARCPRISVCWRPRLRRTIGCSLTWRRFWGRISPCREEDWAGRRCFCRR